MRRLAVSLVRDESRADDIVQQAYLVAIERPPARQAALRAWLRRVVHTLACRSHRAERRRGAREAIVAAARDRFTDAPDALAEEVELQHTIVGLVLALDEPQRSTLLMRYFEDLSPSEIARREGVAVTTIRSRLSRTVLALRGQMDRRSHGSRRAWAAVLLSSADLPAVPSSVQTPPPSVSTTAWVGQIGVIAVTSKTTLVAVAAVVLLGGIGLWSLGDGDTEVPPSDVPAGSADTGPAEDLRDARAQVRRLRQQNSRLDAAVVRLTAELVEARQGAAALRAAAEEDEPEDEPSGPLDWSALSSLMARCIGPLGQHKAAKDLSPIDQAKLVHLDAEISKLAAEARALTAGPFFDERVLPQLVVALSKEALSLTDEQVQRLTQVTRDVVADTPQNAADLPGIERFRLRARVIDRIFRETEALLAPTQTATWWIVRDYLAGTLKFGGTISVGVDVEAESFLANWVLNALPDHAEDISTADLVPAAEAYFDRARTLVGEHGDSNEALAALDSATAAALRAQFLQSQIRFEDEVGALLTWEQAEALRRTEPMVIRFGYGSGISIHGRAGEF